MRTTFFKSAILTILTLSLIACGSQNGSNSSIQTRIVNGSVVDPIASPQILKVVVNAEAPNQSLCTGTVIGSNSILTASHCVIGADRVAVEVDSVLIPASRVELFPGYVESPELNAIFNDLAVIQTATPLGKPALPILFGTPVVEGSRIGIYGFGLDENREFGILKSGSMTASLVTPNHLFADFDGKEANACNGDSGGPATAEILDESGQLVAVGIVGIVSSGRIPDCSAGDTTLFTNLQEPGVIEFLSSIVPDLAVI